MLFGNKKLELKAGIYCPKNVSQKGLTKRIINLSKTVDIFLGPEYLFDKKGEKVYEKYEKKDIFGRIANANSSSLIIPGTILWHDNSCVYNTCPIIYGGNIHEYNKYSDDPTVNSLAKLNNLRVGYGSGQKVHEWRGMKFIVEICNDKGHGKWHNFGEDLAPADIYFFTSMENMLSGITTPVKKGFLLQSDLYFGAECSSKNKNRIKPVKVIKRIKEKDYSFYVFNLKLNMN